MESEDAFARMLELYLRALPNLNVALDGFRFLKVLRETDSEISVVGLCYVLPASEVPMKLTLVKETEFTTYILLFGDLSSQSAEKRWKAVYLYASGDAEKTWSWQKPISGKLNNNLQ